MPQYNHRVEEAERLNVSPRTVSEWMSKRIIPFRKVGRCVLFNPAEVDAALSRFTVAAVGDAKPRRRKMAAQAS